MQMLKGKMQLPYVTCLSQRYVCVPDRIILGEVRDAAACELLSVMNTGHEKKKKKVHVITQKQY